MSTSTVLLNVLCGSASRSARSAAAITTAPASPLSGPPATAQAKTDAATQDTGMVGAPALMSLVVSISRVLRMSRAATATPAGTSQGGRPRGLAEAATVTTVHAATTASAANTAAVGAQR